MPPTSPTSCPPIVLSVDKAIVRDTILLTGATGFLGAFLLQALSADSCPLLPVVALESSDLPRMRIVCVVRAKDDLAALKRVG